MVKPGKGRGLPRAVKWLAIILGCLVTGGVFFAFVFPILYFGYACTR